MTPAVIGRVEPRRPAAAGAELPAVARLVGLVDLPPRGHKQRKTVERCMSKFKQWRGLATRYGKATTMYLAGLHLAAISI
ncbi:hypothetical protein GCM10010521_64250 [Streptomyces rameus]|uniref:Transposase n=1 Tax=Streptomyces rameus TaxID=68261 RepID=A0ABP6HM64_9ACTN